MTWSMIFLPELNSIKDMASRQSSMGGPDWQVFRWPFFESLIWMCFTQHKEMVAIMTENSFLSFLSKKEKEKETHPVHNMIPIKCSQTYMHNYFVVNVNIMVSDIYIFQ